MELHQYDVVIVGSGMAGAIVAKTLTDAGKKVLMLDAGLDEGMALSGQEAFETHTKYLQAFYQALAKAPNSPYPKNENALSADVLDIRVVHPGVPSHGYLVQMGPLPFASDNLIGAGGTMLHWLGTTLRMLPNDFKMQKHYKRGVDWPIGYQDLVPYYEMAEYEIGVAGDVNEQKLPNMGQEYFSKGYVFPMEKIPQSYLDKKMLEETQGLEVTMGGHVYTIECCSTPQGRNSSPNDAYSFAGITWDPIGKKLQLIRATAGNEGYHPVGAVWDPHTGQRCEGNASCVPICPVQAKYNSLKTIKKATQRNKTLLDIRTQAVVYDLIIDEQTKKINGIKYKKYKNSTAPEYTCEVATGQIYVLAASAIENAKILLAAGAANSSDQVGRNLMDHLCLLTWGLFPEKVYPFRGPGSTTNIANFRDGDFRKDHAAWICPIDNWGWGWPEFSPGSDVSEALTKGMFGTELRAHLNQELTKQVLLHFECEQDPDPNNRVTIDDSFKDRLGNHKPVIHYNVSEYMLKAFEAAKTVSDQIFKVNKISDQTEYKADEPDFVRYNNKGYTFRGAGHIVGTHRMGREKETSVVDPEQRTWDHENLFLVGCGNMPTLGTSNPTLTMAALTFKASEAILTQLK
jgi:choline dehydrogenase-like flavoprotein